MRISQNLTLVVLGTLCAPLVAGEEPGSSSAGAVAGKTAEDKAAGQEQYLLRYKFSPGEIIRWKVVHLGTTETKISGNTQTSKSRSTSTKRWQVTEVDAQGNVTFAHSVEHVDMWQKLSDRPEVSFNSDKDETAPAEYQNVAQTVGRTLTTVTIRPDGEILEKNSDSPHVSFGLGDIVMLLPPKPVRAGSRWYEPAEIQVRQADGHVQRIKARKLYRLEKVLTGVASISVKTEVLTPINDARIQAQLVQQLTEGTIRFDVDAGRVLAKQMDWDATVVGFNGADSMMRYLARFSEELLAPQGVTVQTAPPKDKPASGSSDQTPATARAAAAGESASRK